MVYSAYGIVLLVKFWQDGKKYLVARFPSFMHSRRIDDRIRSLSARIAEASNHELEPILQELHGNKFARFLKRGARVNENQYRRASTAERNSENAAFPFQFMETRQQWAQGRAVGLVNPIFQRGGQKIFSDFLLDTPFAICIIELIQVTRGRGPSFPRRFSCRSTSQPTTAFRSMCRSSTR